MPHLSRQPWSVLGYVELRVDRRQEPVEVPAAKALLEPDPLRDVRTLRLQEGYKVHLHASHTFTVGSMLNFVQMIWEVKAENNESTLQQLQRF
jgi:hypothetical protein